MSLMFTYHVDYGPVGVFIGITTTSSNGSDEDRRLVEKKAGMVNAGSFPSFALRLLPNLMLQRSIAVVLPVE